MQGKTKRHISILLIVLGSLLFTAAIVTNFVILFDIYGKVNLVTDIDSGIPLAASGAFVNLAVVAGVVGVAIGTVGFTILINYRKVAGISTSPKIKKN